MSDSEYEVESLTGRDNYWIWKIRMLDLFHLYGLHDIVVGTEPLPVVRGDTSETIPSQEARVAAVPTITQAHVDSWADRDQRALGILHRHVATGPLIHIRNSEGAHQAWVTLQQMYEQTGPIAIGHLRRELYSAQMTESDDLVEYIGHMRMILHKLNVALSAGGHPETTQLEFIHALLTSLPPSYGALVSTFDGKPEADDPNGEALSERLLGRLIDEDQRRRLCYGAPNPQMRKSSTTGRRSGDKRSNQSSEGGQGGSRQTSDGNRMACGHCGRIGHAQAQCYAPGGPKDRRGNNRGGNDYAV